MIELHAASQPSLITHPGIPCQGAGTGGGGTYKDWSTLVHLGPEMCLMSHPAAPGATARPGRSGRPRGTEVEAVRLQSQSEDPADLRICKVLALS